MTGRWSALSALPFLSLLVVWPVPATAATRVACVGDSITLGARSQAPKRYPAQLGTLLGATYEVGNFGVSGATLLRQGDIPYVNSGRYAPSGAFNPDIVVIMLGTNDSKAPNWAKRDAFDGDYKALIAHYQGLPAHPRVFAVLPPPVFGVNPYGIRGPTIATEVVPAVTKVAADTGITAIDVFTALAGAGADFADGVHPNDDGNSKIADAVFKVLAGAIAGADAGPGADAADAASDSAGTVTDSAASGAADAAAESGITDAGAGGSGGTAVVPGGGSAGGSGTATTDAGPRASQASGCAVAGAGRAGGGPTAPIVLLLALAGGRGAARAHRSRGG